MGILSDPKSDPLEQSKEGISTSPPSITGIETPENVKQREAAVAPPPNGGLTAWLQVLGGTFCFFNTWYAHIICVNSSVLSRVDDLIFWQ